MDADVHCVPSAADAIGLAFFERGTGEPLSANRCARLLLASSPADAIARFIQEVERLLTPTAHSINPLAQGRLAFMLTLSGGKTHRLDVRFAEATYRGRAAIFCAFMEREPVEQTRAVAPPRSSGPAHAADPIAGSARRATPGRRGAEPAPRSEVSAAAAARFRTRHSLRLLLVEDHPANQIVMRRQLEVLGQHVDLVGRAADALPLAAAHQYDLILTDLQMPEMDGYTLARRLREAGVRTPIVAVTANTGDEVKPSCWAAGIDGYLAKPVLLSTLCDLIDGTPKRSPGPRLAPRRAHYDEPSLSDVLKGDLNDLVEAVRSDDALRFARRLHALCGALSKLGHMPESRAARDLLNTVRWAGIRAIGRDWDTFRTELECLIERYEGDHFDFATARPDARHAVRLHN